MQQETHSAQAQKCRVGEGGLSDILGLDAVNVGGAETHVHTMQYIRLQLLCGDRTDTAAAGRKCPHRLLVNSFIAFTPDRGRTASSLVR